VQHITAVLYDTAALCVTVVLAAMAMDCSTINAREKQEKHIP
jgi:hypothetical protein